ncbi:MFS transporter [Candidatus Lokiarchaeum ossiferum]|uniref:MFS transporter n=1 Tax=Candidatus Lokiarchaeum ossiferum TaxID=2951803 RepID=UPI00352E56CD
MTTNDENKQNMDTTHNQAMQSNIKKYFVAMFFRNLWISMPVGILYFQARGLSFTQIGLLEAIISAVIFFTDIPSGAFADIFGRKLSTSLGMGLWGLSLILTAVFTTFNGYIFAAILMGFGDSLISGAINALFYDTLKQMGKDQEYIKYTSQRDIITSVAIILASILGAIFYTIDIRLPYLVHGITLTIAGIIVFTMKEPITFEKSKTVVAQYKLISKSLGFVWKNHIVRFITIFWVLVLTVPMLFCNMMESFYLVEINIPVIYFGLIFAFTRGVIGFFAPLRFSIEKKLGEKGSFYGITIIFGVMLFLMVLLTTPLSLAFVFIFFFTRDYTWTILDKYANDHIPSDRRATVLSIINFCLNLVYMGFALLAGYSMDHSSFLGLNSLLSTMLVLGAATFVILIPFLMANYRKLGAQKEIPSSGE